MRRPGHGSARSRRAIFASAIALLGVPCPTFAQGAPTKDVVEPGDANTSGGVALQVSGSHASDLFADDLAVALERELGQPAHVGPANQGETTVEVEVTDTNVRARVIKPDGTTLERSIERPGDDARLAEVALWLCSNLARDEAAELLAELQAKQNGGEPTSETEATPTPPKEKPTESPTEQAAPDREAPPTPEPTEPVVKAWPEWTSPYIQLSFVHPLSLAPRGDSEGCFAFAHSLLHANSACVRGVNIDAIGGRRGSLQGVSITSVWDRVDERWSGVRVTGVASLDKSRSGGDGLLISGVLAYDAVRDVPGQGARLAGVAQISPGSVDGITMAGVVSWVGDLNGVSIATLNVARDVAGAQVGIINIGRKIKGSMVGFVNVAERVDGVPVAPVNIIETGGVQAIAYVGTHALFNGGVRFLTNAEELGFLSEVTLGYDPRDDEVGDPPTASSARFVAPELSFGARLPFKPLWTSLDTAAATRFNVDALDQNPQHSVRLRASLGWDPSDYLGLFVGAGARMFTEDRSLEPDFAGGVSFF